MGGITSSTENKLLYGTNAYMTVDAVDLGATTGDFSVEWSAEMYYPDLAQALGPVSGTGRVVKAEFRLKTTLTEWTYAVLAGILATYGATSDANSETIGGGTMGPITEVDDVLLTGLTRNDAKPVMVIIPRAYVEAGNLAVSKSKETGIETTFHGLYNATYPSRMPGKIMIGK
jgi:hypothetical protein